MGVIKRTPRLWEYLYDNPVFIRRTQKIKDAVHKANFKKFDKLFAEFNPTAVVCAQAYPCGLIADYKRVFGIRVPLFGVLTDFLPHAYWVYKEVDYFIVPSEEAQVRLISEGVAEGRIKKLGIPIDPKFSLPLKREEIFAKLRLDPALPVVLIMGGGQGLGPIKHVVTALEKTDRDVQLIVVTGINSKLLKWLKAKSADFLNRVFPLEYANNIEELMEISEIIVSKPGGLTTAEALAKGLPMVIVKPIPGQEENNTRILLRRGVAVRVDQPEEITREIEVLLHNRQRLQLMRTKAKALGRPDSAFDIARLILQHHD